MKTPYELAYRYVIPYIQRKLVLALKARGLNNTEIAKKLGMTPSAVTRYLKGERGTTIDLSTHKDVEELIKNLADRIAEADPDQYYLITAITAITTYILTRKYLCTHHAAIDPIIDPTKCNACPQAIKTVNLQALFKN